MTTTMITIIFIYYYHHSFRLQILIVLDTSSFTRTGCPSGQPLEDPILCCPLDLPGKMDSDIDRDMKYTDQIAIDLLLPVLILFIFINLHIYTFKSFKKMWTILQTKRFPL